MEIKKEFRKHFRSRPLTSHKGDYGRIFVIAGSQGLSGACYLASMAALRSGAGLVTVGVPKSLTLSLARRLTEAMMLPLPQTKGGTLAAWPFVLYFAFWIRKMFSPSALGFLLIHKHKM